MNQKIQREILAEGPVPFARFMELALGTYYEKQKEIGRRGDFYTSVSVGPVFGQLLAFQFAEWARDLEAIQLVEAGAHQGQLASDILRWVRNWRPEIFARLKYYIIEPSAIRRQWQEETLKDFSGKVFWQPEFDESITGIIFSNELLDVMPVHRLCWDAAEKKWLEWKVGWDGTKFIWSKSSLSGLTPPKVAAELAAILPDEFTVEISPAAVNWWGQAAAHLQCGKLLAIDYGLSAEEFFRPERSGGTLRAYAGHHLATDLLANPGQQDITAHVNFSAVQDAGEAACLKTDALISQAKFLTEIFEKTTKNPTMFEPWNSARVKQFQTLTHPAHLGRSFKVLVQSR